MITSNGSRVFIDNKNSITCYNFDYASETWSPYGAHYLNGAEKNGKVVQSSEGVKISFNANKGGNRVVAHNMGTNDVDIYEINTKTYVWKKIQTLENIEYYTTYSGGYVFDFIGNHMILYIDNNSDQGDVKYYAYNSTNKTFELKFTLLNASGVSNIKSLRRVVMNKDGTRFAVSDTNGNIYDANTNDNGNGVVKIYDVDLSDYSYSLIGTLSSSNSSGLFGDSISMNLSGSRLVVSEPLEYSYYVYEYASSTWSIVGGSALSFYDSSVSRFNNIIKINALGDAFFASEYDTYDESLSGLVHGYYQDNSGNWNHYDELSGNFYEDISSSIDTNLFHTDASFTTTFSFGSILSLNSQGNRLLVGSNESSNNVEGIVLKLKKDTSAPSQSLKDLGVSGNDIVKLELTPAELVGDSGLNTEELKELGVGADTLLVGGTSESDLLNSGFGLDDIVGASNDLSSLVSDPSNNVKAIDLLASASVSDLLTKGIGVSDLLNDISNSDTSGTTLDFSQFKDANVSATDLKSSGVDASTLKNAAYDASDLVGAGFAVTELKDAAIPASDLKSAGLGLSDLDGTFSPEDLVNAEFDDADFESAGYTVEPAKTLTVSVGPVTLTQEVKTVVKNPDISNFNTSLPDSDTVTQIIANNPSVSNVITVKAYDDSGLFINDISSNPIVMTFDFPDLDPTEKHVLCKMNQSNTLIVPQPLGYPIPLTYNPITSKYTGSFTNLSTASTFFASTAPESDGSEPIVYFASYDNLVNGSTTSETTFTLYMTLGWNRKFRSSSTSLFNTENCSITVTNYKNFNNNGNNSTRNISTQILKNIKDANPGFIAPGAKNQNINAYNTIFTPTIGGYNGNNRVIKYFDVKKITLTVTEPEILGKWISISNKTDGDERLEDRQTNTYVNTLSTFSFYYDITIPSFVDMFTRESTIYIHTPDPSNPNVVEYYTNKTGKVVVYMTSNIYIDKNSMDLTMIKTNNATISTIKIVSNKLEHEMQIYGSIDPESPTTYVSVEFPPGSIVDRQGNINTESSKFSYLIDTIPPTMEISSDISSNETTNTSYINLYFTPNKQIRSLTRDAFQVENGQIGSLTYENGIYKTTLIPIESLKLSDAQISIYLKESTIQDLGGNLNEVISNTFIWNYDGSSPTVSITSSDISNNQYYNLDFINLSLIFSENVVDFTENMITVENGEITRFKTVNSKSYTCRLYPLDAINSARITVSVAANVVEDERGNLNFASTPFVWNYDFDKPVLTLSSKLASRASSEDGYILYTLYSSKKLSEISLDSFTVENATIVDLQGSGQTYTVKLYPLGNSRTSIVVNKFGVRDTANNLNDLKSNSFDPNPYYWTYSGSKPIISLDSIDIDLAGKSKEQSVEVVMKINDTSLTLTQSDLNISSNAMVSNFSFDSTNEYYTMDFIASAPYETITMQVPENVVGYSETIYNSESNTLSWVWDKDRATMTISSNDISSGELTNDAFITLLFTPSEQIQEFTSSDITVSSNARITDFESSGNNFTASLRPNNGVKSGLITAMVSENKFKSMYGYFNTSSSNVFSWNYDIVLPTASIYSDFIDNNTTNNNYSEDMVVEFSKDINDIDSSVFTVVNGYVSDIAKITSQKYTFKLHTAQTISSIQNVQIFIGSNKIQDFAGNYNSSSSNTFTWNSDTTPIEVTNVYAEYYYRTSNNSTWYGPLSVLDNTGYEYNDYSRGGNNRRDYFNQKKYYIYFEFNKPFNSTYTTVGTVSITDNVDENDEGVQYIFNGVTMLNNNRLLRVNGFRPYYRFGSSALNPQIAKARIFIEKDKIQDEYGNTNTTEIQGFRFIYDRTYPEVTIYAKTIDTNEDVSSNTTTNDPSVYVYIRFSKRVRTYNNDSSKIITTNCNLSDKTWTINDTEVRYILNPIDRNLQTSFTVDADFAQDLASSSKYSLAAEETFYWTSDIEGPIIQISTTTQKADGELVQSGEMIDFQDLSMVFTFNDAPTSFSASDISLSNAEIIAGTFTEVSGTEYTVDVRSSTDGGNVSIFIPEDNNITDSAGNISKAHNVFSWYYNNVTPQLASVYSNEVSNNGFTDEDTIYLYLVAEDVIYLETTILQTLITNGTVTNLYSEDNITFIATIEKSGTEDEKKITLFIPKNTFANDTGLTNNETYEFSYTYFNKRPLINITSTVASGAIDKLNSIDLKFTESNGLDLYDFVESDIKISPDDSSKYYLTDFSGNGSEYTATLHVVDDETVVVYTNIYSYRNVVGALNVQESVFRYTRDTAPVTINIYSSLINSGGESDDPAVDIIIQFNKTTIKRLDILDVINYSNASLEALIQDENDARIFTTKLIPKVKNTPSSLYFSANDIEDHIGNTNTSASNTFQWTFVGANPTVTITSDQIPNGSIYKLADISLNITLEGDDVQLELSDISYSNGTLTNFSGSNNVYTADFTATTKMEESFIFVDAGSITDSFGVSNLPSAKFIWSYNDTSPFITIFNDDGINTTEYSNRSKFNFSFVASHDDITGFTIDDVEVSGGTLDSLVLQSDGLTYKSVFTPSITQGLIQLSISGENFTNGLGVAGLDSNVFKINYDSIVPVIDVSTSIPSGSSSSDSYVIIDFTSSKKLKTFNFDDILAINCDIVNTDTNTDTYQFFSITVQPRNNDIVSVKLPAGVAFDDAGNTNAALDTFEWTYDNVAIFNTLTARDLTRTQGSSTTIQSQRFFIQTNDDSITIQESDLSYSNLSIDSFAQDAGNQTLYYLTVSSLSEGIENKLFIPANIIQDDAGNYNVASAIFTWVYDSNPPQATISSPDISSGDITNDAQITLYFDTTEKVTGFTKEIISIINGYISEDALVQVSDTRYKGTLIPIVNGEIRVSIGSGTFTDTAGVPSVDTTDFVWNYDDVGPALALKTNPEFASRSYKPQVSISMELLVLNDSSLNIVESDISFNEGLIRDFVQAGPSKYTFEYVAANDGVLNNIFIPAGQISDFAGNTNKQLVSFQWIYDATPLTIETFVADEVDLSGTTNSSRVNFTITLSDVAFDLTSSLVQLTNCVLSSFAKDATDASGTSYRLAVDVLGTYALPVVTIRDDLLITTGRNINKFITGSNHAFYWVYDNEPPLVSFSSLQQKNYIKNNSDYIDLLITSNKDLESFTNEVLSAPNGVSIGDISGYDDTSRNFIARITPSETTDVVVRLLPGKLVDSVGNINVQSDVSFTWYYDVTPPTIEISSNVVNGSSSDDSYIDLSFIASKEITGFTFGDITVSNATLTNFTGSGTEYSAQLKPKIGNTQSTVLVKMNSVVDSAGNYNDTSSNTFTWTYTGNEVILTLSSNDVENGGYYKQDSITVNVNTGSSVLNTTSFVSDDIVATNGTISNLQSVDDYNYSFTFTSSGVNTLSSVYIPADRMFSSANNSDLNLESNTYTWTYDDTKPTVELLCEDMESGDYNNAPFIFIDISFSESVTFSSDDIVITNANLSDFTGRDDLYTVKVSPTISNGQITVNVPVNTAYDIAENYNDTASNTFVWNYDNVAPTITISSDDVANDGEVDVSSVVIKITASEDINGISIASFSYKDCIISDISGSGSNYTAKVTTGDFSKDARIEIEIDEGKITDKAGNKNTSASNEFKFQINKEVVRKKDADDLATTLAQFDDVDTGDVDETELSIALSTTVSTSLTTKTSLPSFISRNTNRRVFKFLMDQIFERQDTTSKKRARFERTNIPLKTKAETVLGDKEDLIIASSNQSVVFSDLATDTANEAVYIPLSEEGDYIEMTLITGDVLKITQTETDIFDVLKNSTTDLGTFDANDDDNDTLTIGNYTFVFGSMTANYDAPTLGEYIYENCDITGGAIDNSYTSISTFSSWFSSKSLVWNDAIYADNLGDYKGWKYQDMLTYNSGLSKNSFVQYAIQYCQEYYYAVGVAVYHDKITTDSSDYTYVTFRETDSTASYANHDDVYRYVLSATEISSLSSYEITEVPETVYENSTTVSGEDTSGTDVSGDETTNTIDWSADGVFVLPCFLEGTKILTTKGYKLVQQIVPGVDVLVDDKGKRLECKEVGKYYKKYDGEDFPYVVPGGSYMNEKFTCSEDLYLTHNHCIYIPHMDKFVPSSLLKLRQDKTMVEGYTYYHVFTENYFTDCIIANGIPCESHSKYIKNTIQEIDSTGILMKHILSQCNAKVNGMRSRLSKKQFKNIIKSFKKMIKNEARKKRR
jgi:uncharacterized protein YjbI with pentapeptide repeats